MFFLNYLGGGFKYIFMFTPTWGRFPFWLIDIIQGDWNYQLALDPNNPWKNEGFKPPIYGL